MNRICFSMTASVTGKLNFRPRKSDVKINLAVPAYRGEYSSPCVRSLFGILTASSLAGVKFSFSEIDYSDIVVSLNYLISNFYFNKPDCSHILFVDSDMGFPCELLVSMLALKEDVVGVVYPRRSMDLRRMHELGSFSFAKAYARACQFVGSPGAAHPKNPAFRRVDYCGTGILLISRQCVDKMVKRIPDMVDHVRFKGLQFSEKFNSFLTPFNKVLLADRELSEDLSFCHRWTNDCHGLIYADVSCDIEHVAGITVRTCFADSLPQGET